MPGGLIHIDVPAEAPSRAYAKIEEAIVWARLPVAAGQIALEIGAAPGGASAVSIPSGPFWRSISPACAPFPATSATTLPRPDPSRATSARATSSRAASAGGGSTQQRRRSKG